MSSSATPLLLTRAPPFALVRLPPSPLADTLGSADPALAARPAVVCPGGSVCDCARGAGSTCARLAPPDMPSVKDLADAAAPATLANSAP